MSRESHREFLERSARRAAAKAREHRHEERWTAAEIGKLKIQTVEPWKRVLVGLIGVACFAGGLWAWAAGIAWLAIVLCIAGVLFVLGALVGRRTTVEAVFNSVDILEFFSGIFDVIDS